MAFSRRSRGPRGVVGGGRTHGSVVGPGLELAIETAASPALTRVYKEDDQNREQTGLLNQVVGSPKRFARRPLLALGSGHTGLLTVNRQSNDPISTAAHILLSVFCKRGITGNYPCIRAPTREASVTITTQLITQRVPGVVVDRIDHMGGGVGRYRQRLERQCLSRSSSMSAPNST